jgi:ABC-type transporter Mla subunit MlaD
VKPILGIAAVIVVVVAAGVLVFLARENEETYQVRAIFDNAGFVIPGEDVKIAGVKVGKIESIDITEDFKAAVVLEITEEGYQDFRRDASCTVRPQNLIGERFVECKPTQPRSAGAEAPGELQVIEDGPGEGQRLLGVENTTMTVDIDLIGNTMRAPERERLSLILNELGTGLAGRGRDLNEVIRRANPALRETDKVLAILARQNTVLEQLAVNSDTVLAPLARDRARVAGAIRNSSDVARATAERRDDLAADIETLPEFLDELEPTMERLSSLADEATPVFADLGDRADDINTLVRRQGPFAQAAIPAVDSLGEASKAGTPAVTDARPVIRDTRALANALRPVGSDLREVLESFRDSQGIERLMDYIFYQVAAINGFDAVGHYLRAGLIVNQCASYAVEPVPGCSANFPQGASSSSASDPQATAASAIRAAGDDPVLRRTAIALARALGQEIEKVKRQESRKNKKASKDRKASKKRKRGARAERRTGTTAPAATPGAAPAAPVASAPGSDGAAATPAPTEPVPPPADGGAPPAAGTPEATATPTPTSDPSSALLDYLFGDGPE